MVRLQVRRDYVRRIYVLQGPSFRSLRPQTSYVTDFKHLNATLKNLNSRMQAEVNAEQRSGWPYVQLEYHTCADEGKVVCELLRAANDPTCKSILLAPGYLYREAPILRGVLKDLQAGAKCDAHIQEIIPEIRTGKDGSELSQYCHGMVHGYGTIMGLEMGIYHALRRIEDEFVKIAGKRKEQPATHLSEQNPKQDAELVGEKRKLPKMRRGTSVSNIVQSPSPPPSAASVKNSFDVDSHVIEQQYLEGTRSHRVRDSPERLRTTSLLYPPSYLSRDSAANYIEQQYFSDLLEDDTPSELVGTTDPIGIPSAATPSNDPPARSTGSQASQYHGSAADREDNLIEQQYFGYLLSAETSQKGGKL
ncbi:hypothetical protein DFJ77DRAFT_509591 [Powellomyces hirtus]|nr:hypothetical protein DFJ77DRAFT_509591 [Powellomyces hirtus]